MKGDYFCPYRIIILKIVISGYSFDIEPRKISQTLAFILPRISPVLVRELIFVPVSPRISSTRVQKHLPPHSSLIPLVVCLLSRLNWRAIPQLLPLRLIGNMVFVPFKSRPGSAIRKSPGQR